MQITTNTTGMPADLCIARDQAAHDLCVIVIKGTFDADVDGLLTLATGQQALTYADEHYDAPASSSVRYEYDFAPEKSRTDVIVVGNAVAPAGRPVEEMLVRLEVQGQVKELLVIGDRRWKSGLLGLTPSKPEPFTEMPLTFDRAFGGQDTSLGESQIAVEQRNLAGVGFHPHRRTDALVGQPLPNIEHPRQRIRSPRDNPDPVGVGCIGRAWKPRIDYAGTYDQRWVDTVCPLLPDDFDGRYFQCAPEDQQFPIFQGGELIRCVHMSKDGIVAYRIPQLRVPVRFRFGDQEVERNAQLDTVVLLPNEKRATLTWRSHVRLGKKWNRLRGVLVGEQPALADDDRIDYSQGKPKFQSLGAAIRWLKKRQPVRA